MARVGDHATHMGKLTLKLENERLFGPPLTDTKLCVTQSHLNNASKRCARAPPNWQKNLIAKNWQLLWLMHILKGH